MGLVLSGGAKSSSKFMQVPPGMHLARCYRIVDLGTQTMNFDGTTSQKHRVMLQFEIHSEDEQGNPLVTQNGDPLSISKTYTANITHELATLRKDLVSWRGREFTGEELANFDLSRLLNQWAMVSVAMKAGKDGRDYAEIANINAVPANIKKAGLPEPHNEAKIFDLSNPDMALYESFSDGLRAKIESSLEWQNRSVTHKQSAKEDDLEDDVPF